MAQPPRSDKGGPSEALRTAIERTFEATVGSASQARTRAGELLDQVARRGRGGRGRIERLQTAVRDEVERRRKP